MPSNYVRSFNRIPDESIELPLTSVRRRSFSKDKYIPPHKFHLEDNQNIITCVRKGLFQKAIKILLNEDPETAWAIIIKICLNEISPTASLTLLAVWHLYQTYPNNKIALATALAILCNASKSPVNNIACEYIDSFEYDILQVKVEHLEKSLISALKDRRLHDCLYFMTFLYKSKKYNNIWNIFTSVIGGAYVRKLCQISHQYHKELDSKILYIHIINLWCNFNSEFLPLIDNYICQPNPDLEIYFKSSNVSSIVDCQQDFIWNELIKMYIKYKNY